MTEESPLVSVVMPVYNAAPFLREAIDSVLNQTFPDFEFIIINDGSTDASDAIIRSYADPRIVYLTNDKNSGLVFTLNKGIDAAKGKYIARMDGDDVCLPDRLLTQKKMLEEEPELSAVASVVKMINERGEHSKRWTLDEETTSWKTIRRKMPRENCIAHPSVMIRTPVAKKIRYKEYQKNIEDYDLWLRLLNRNHRIGKFPSVLLLYRIHSSSVTGTVLKQSNFFFKHVSMKRKFIWNELRAGQISFFLLKVTLSMFADTVKGVAKFAKTKISS
jgi:glycosyltransferase involved in cell wall biosynthesis